MPAKRRDGMLYLLFREQDSRNICFRASHCCCHWWPWCGWSSCLPHDDLRTLSELQPPLAAACAVSRTSKTTEHAVNYNRRHEVADRNGSDRAIDPACQLAPFEIPG